MKKLLIVLGLLVLTLFVVSCAPKESSVDEKLAAEDLTPEEKAQLPADLKEGETALAGQAVNFGNCVDGDATTPLDKNSLTVKSKTTYASGSFEDKCYTWNAGTPQEKTRLIEGTCKNSKFIYWYATCEDYLGKFAKCNEGKCVQPVMCGNTTPETYCLDINTITKTKDTCTGKVTLSFTNGNEKCNPNKNESIGWGGGGFSLVLGQKCENNLLYISDALKIDCSQEQGWLNKKTCAEFTGKEVKYGTELLEFGKSICKELCTPGQVITTCDEDGEYYQQICNDAGFGWYGGDGGGDGVSSCPNGQTCNADEKDYGVCK